jgi:Putative prokaryotic signal transducing protein
MKNHSDDFIEFVPVIETHNAGDRVFLKSILDAEGISYFIQGEYVAPYMFNALPMTFMVRKDQAERAKEILKDVELTYSYSYGGKDGPEEDT